MPFEPKGTRIIRKLLWKPDTPLPVEGLSKLVYRGQTYSKQARVAIMGDADCLNQIPQHLAKDLESDRNYHWSGAGRILERGRRVPRVLMGEYTEWFQWYMRYQRFKAFQTIVLIDPLQAVSDNERGGFVDGLLARLMTRVLQIAIVNRSAEEVLPQSDESHVNCVLMSLLYGTRLSRRELVDATKSTFMPISDQQIQEILDGYRWQTSLRNSRYELTEDDEELVQGMVPEWKRVGSGEPPDKIEQLFHRRTKREYIRPAAGWIEAEVLALVRTKGWFTAQSLAEHFHKRFWEFGRSTVPPPKEVYPDDQREYRTEAQVFLPSPSIVRRVCDRLVKQGRLTMHQWYRDIGRPAAVYTEPGGALPFREDARCGQCAFYRPAKNQCRMWSLASWKYRSWGYKWEGTATVNNFEMYKMKNSYKIGPHASACWLFLDKKRDHPRKTIPAECEICAASLARAGGDKTALCPNCNTKYAPWWGKVRVQTSYEHEFRRRYKEVTGSEAEVDERERNAELATSPLREYERALELDSEPDKRTALQRSEREPSGWPKSSFNPSLQRLVDSRAQTADYSRLLSSAMIQSALNATRRLAVVGRPDRALVEEATRRQEMYLSHVGESEVGRLITLEAHAMREYWSCYDSALKPALQWFGPRKRFRFVADNVADPGGRARGYSALHAGINYLHQRKLRQALRINAEVGFEGTADGFLHRKRYNSRRLGLLFDMIDPFKFADREELLAVVLNRGITWRDFKMESDRRDSTFYYPGPSATAVLDRAGADADQLVVRYAGIDSNLIDAYRRFAASMLESIETTRGSIVLEPFVYTPV